MSTPLLLCLVFGIGPLAVWYFRARAARTSKRDAAASKNRTAGLRSAQSVEKAIKGRR